MFRYKKNDARDCMIEMSYHTSIILSLPQIKIRFDFSEEEITVDNGVVVARFFAVGQTLGRDDTPSGRKRLYDRVEIGLEEEWDTV